MKNILVGDVKPKDDEDGVLEKVPRLCDNESVVKLANNPVQHSRTKHIDIRHHFLRDHVAKKIRH